MRSSWLLVLGFLLAGPAARLAQGHIGSAIPDLPSLCDRADLVVVGVATAVHEDGPTTLVESGVTLPGRLMVVELDAKKILRGERTTGPVTFTFSMPTVPVVSVGGVPVSRGQFGVFFLRKGSRGYEVLDPDHPFVLATPGAPRTPGGLVDQVTAEVAHVLETPTEPDRLKEQAVSILASSQSSVAAAALKAATRNQPLNVRLGAMAVLIARGDISLLPEAQQLLLSSDPRIRPDRRDNLASALGYGVRDARAVPFLAPLLRSGDVFVRRGAASALRNTRSATATKPLGQALYDSDRDVQYQAVIGLAEITGTVGEWAPATSTFLQDPQHYLDHWRDWAKSQK